MANERATGVYNKRGKCQIRWWEGSVRRTETLPITYNPTGIASAQRIRARKIQAFAEGREEATEWQPMPTFGEMAQDKLDEIRHGKPSSHRAIKSRLQLYWMPKLSRHLLTQIKQKHVKEIVNDMRDQGRSPKYIREVISAGSSVLQMAIENEYIDHNPTKAVSRAFTRKSKTKVQIDPFTQEEMDAVMPLLSQDDKLFFALRWYCGLRPGEVIALTRQDIRSGYIYVNKSRVEGNDGTTKTGSERQVPLPPQVSALISSRVTDMRNDHLLLTQYGKPYLKPRVFNERFVRALKEAGVRYRNPYNVRHGAACRMLAAGMKPGYCAKILGHSLQMFFTTYANWVDAEETKAQEEIMRSLK